MANPNMQQQNLTLFVHAVCQVVGAEGGTQLQQPACRNFKSARHLAMLSYKITSTGCSQNSYQTLAAVLSDTEQAAAQQRQYSTVADSNVTTGRLQLAAACYVEFHKCHMTLTWPTTAFFQPLACSGSVRQGHTGRKITCKQSQQTKYLACYAASLARKDSSTDVPAVCLWQPATAAGTCFPCMNHVPCKPQEAHARNAGCCVQHALSLLAT
jgi:hypothetical protein